MFFIKKNQKNRFQDLTLESTTNADAAGQRIGISAITKSISARQR